MADRAAAQARSDISNVFVGRVRELEFLRESLNAAMSGAGRVVALAGEPGIGKTATAARLTEHAEDVGATVLWGTSQQGEAAMPFGPWAVALGKYADQVGADELGRRLGAGAPALMKLFEHAGAVAPATAPAVLSPDQERLRLFDGVTRMLLAVAVDGPVVLVLDDLHWADPDSLALLRYVARAVGGARILVVGTYRTTEVDVDDRHPLGEVLASLADDARYEAIRLAGLGADEIAELLAAAAPQDDAPADLVRVIHVETSGNPFYVRELYRHMREEGRLGTRDDAGMREFGIPETVRHVVRRRLARLSDDTVHLLRIACAFSGGFTFAVLKHASDLGEDALLDAIDEALRGGFLRTAGTDSSRYDFSHALVRNALLDELNPDRVARLHRRIAETLEELYGAEPAGDLATHYHASRAMPGADRGIAHALRAAERAHAVAAHEQAVTFLRMARDLVLEGDDATRADILCRLAIAEADALLLAEAGDSAEIALAALAAAGGDSRTEAEFLAAIAKRLKEGGADRRVWERQVERGIALAGGSRDLTWARLMLLRDPVETVLSGDVNLARWLGHDADAVMVARREGSESDYAMTLEPYEWRSREETGAVLARVRTWRSPSAVIQGFNAVVRDLLHRHDDARGALEPIEEMLAISRRQGSTSGHVEALVQLSFARGLLGDLDGQLAALEQARELVDRLGRTHRLRGVVASGGTDIHHFLTGEGDWERQAALAQAFVARAETGHTPLGFVFTSLAILDHALSGAADQAIRLAAAFVPVLERMPPKHYHQATSVDFTVWALWELDDAQWAAPLARLVRDMVGAGVNGPLVGAHALTAARLHALLADDGASTRAFNQAQDDLASVGKIPVRAIATFDEARALMRRRAGDRERTGALLDAASADFASLGMAGWHRRALSARAKLGGDRFPAGLTAREAEILQLLATGRSNRTMAQELFLSTATIERHVANIYRKIGANSRVQAATFAFDHGLRRDPPT